MQGRELAHILTAVIVFFIVISFSFLIKQMFEDIPQLLFFSIIIILVHVFSKKLMAHLLDSDVEHRLWSISRYGIKPSQYFKKEIPAGIVFPIFFTIFSLGLFRFSSILTYEAKGSKYRAARRFGFMSFTELTDYHNALIGAAGIVSVLLVSLLTYFMPFELDYLARVAAFYAFFNMLPISNLDGSQIFFGSRVLYTTVAIVTLIFATYALIFGISVI